MGRVTILIEKGDWQTLKTKNLGPEGFLEFKFRKFKKFFTLNSPLNLEKSSLLGVTSLEA